MVVHHEGILDELPRHAEGVGAPVYVSGIYNARKAERSPGNGDRYTPNRVVDDLMAAQHVQGISPAVAVDR